MLKRVLLTGLLATTLVMPHFSRAVSLDDGLMGVGVNGFDSGTADPAAVIGQLINIFLGILGVLFLVLVIYAGFLWMTAAGNEGQVEKAKNILVSSVIGLVIILSAYAITNFVIVNLQFASGT